MCKTEKNQIALSAGEKYGTMGQRPSQETWEQDNAMNLPKKREAEEDGTINQPNKEINQEQAVDKAKQEFGLNFCANL